MNDLELLLNCPVCGKKYGYKSARIVEGTKGALLVHVGCDYCSSKSLAVISNPESNSFENPVSVGIMTDLDYEEACKLLKDRPITADEVLDVYQAVHK